MANVQKTTDIEFRDFPDGFDTSAIRHALSELKQPTNTASMLVVYRTAANVVIAFLDDRGNLIATTTRAVFELLPR